jgi:agmatinase
MDANIIPVPVGMPSFINAPRCQNLDELDADVAIVGIPYGVPYDLEASTSPSSTSPDKFRAQSMRFAERLHHYNFDFGGDIFAGRSIKVVDCGSVDMVPGQYAENIQRTSAVYRKIIDKGAFPIGFGGRHDITIPVLRAYEGLEPMYLVQIDAHIDWREEVNGIHDGLSSVMRRASEMPWITGMAQIGMRGTGSARQKDYDDAIAYGSLIIGSKEVRRSGTEAVLERIPDSARYFVTFDVDGMDPSIAPGIASMAFGGLDYFEATELLQGVARKGEVVGFDISVVRPSIDVHDLTSFLAAQMTMNMIGSLAHTGQIGT